MLLVSHVPNIHVLHEERGDKERRTAAQHKHGRRITNDTEEEEGFRREAVITECTDLKIAELTNKLLTKPHPRAAKPPVTSISQHRLA